MLPLQPLLFDEWLRVPLRLHQRLAGAVLAGAAVISHLFELPEAKAEKVEGAIGRNCA
jgi:hypothetical protein